MDATIHWNIPYFTKMFVMTSDKSFFSMFVYFTFTGLHEPKWTQVRRHTSTQTQTKRCFYVTSLYCLTTTKWPKWHSCLESLQLYHLDTKHKFKWHTKLAFRHWQRMIIVFCLLPRLTGFQCRSHDWIFNRLCSCPLYKWYSRRRHKGANVT